MDNLYWLDRIQPHDRPVVGNKAFNFSQLVQRGYPVMPGFVVSAIAFWEWIKTLGESEPLLADLPESSLHVDVDNPRQLQQLCQEIRQAIMGAALPAEWMGVLSAAAEAMQAPAMILHPSLWLPLPVDTVANCTYENRASTVQLPHHPQVLPPGILESYTCTSTAEALEHSLKRVWAELFRARSLFYWQRQGIGIQQLNLAVLVQPIWNAIASGIIHTDPTEWKIQATWGIGQVLAKGEVLPDSYQLQVGTGTVKTQTLGHKILAYRVSNEEGTREDKEDEEIRGKSSEIPLSFPSFPSASTAPVSLRQIPFHSGLQAYILSEEQQKQYALDEKSIKQLIELTQKLTAEFGSTFVLGWAFSHIPRSSQSQLYLTQFILNSPVVNSEPSMSTQPPTSRFTPQLVRGLPAAPGQATAPAQVITDESKTSEEIVPGSILVSKSITPDWLPWLKLAVGIVTEQGGMTSHGAIIARELGIPAVVNAVGATQLIQTGEFLRMDGDQGEIYIVNEPSREPEIERQLNSYFPLPPIATQLLVNLSQPTSLERVVHLPVDGVGLLRAELMMLDALDNQHPDGWLQQGRHRELVARLAHLLMQFAAPFMPRPVLYRSLDWRSHELPFLIGGTSAPEPEVNPVLGLHGTRRVLSDPTFFDLELAALKQVYAYGYTNVRLMLPFVRTVEEFTFCRRRVEQIGLMDHPQFQLWIMAEVPSVLFLLPDYVKAGVQGISIGTNDLTQLLLAVDRNQGQLGFELNERHPAVMQALKQLIQLAKVAGIPCSICGQAPALYPELIDSLVQWGITSISVDVQDVERIYMAIARAEQRLLLEAARQRINH